MIGYFLVKEDLIHIIIYINSIKQRHLWNIYVMEPFGKLKKTEEANIFLQILLIRAPEH